MTRFLRVVLALTLVGAAPAFAADGCADGAVVHVPALGSFEEELTRTGELLGAVAPRPRVLRLGSGWDERVCEGALPGDGGAPLRWVALRQAQGERGGGAAQGERDGGAAQGEGGDASPGGRFGLELLPVRWSSAYNTGFPEDGNDGLLWAGNGYSTMASLGLRGRYGPLSFQLAPEVAWSQNAFFTTAPVQAPFANPFYGGAIDLPQRFGAGPTRSWAPGQSHLRLDLWNVGLGISSENLWWGPGIRNGIILSNAGPGFPHVFLGTSRPGDIGIGTMEALVFWGRLERSKYDPVKATHPLASGLLLDYQPKWVPGLTVGLSRLFVQVWDDLRFLDWLSVVQSFRKKDLRGWYPGEQSENNPRDNQIASLFARWAFPESGFELYGEWTREDHAWSFYEVLREPEYSSGWQLGLQKVWVTGPRWVRLQLEGTYLQQILPLDSRTGTPVFYTHYEDLSLTHRGQVLGAWIGPGGDSQTLAVDVLHAGGRIGGFFERVRRNDAYYWANIEPNRHDPSHDVEVTLGVRQALQAGPFEIAWQFGASHRWSRLWLRDQSNLTGRVDISLPLSAVGRPIAPPGVDSGAP